jgi:CRP/FNR family cyclic AMP-dependent transcriptional regulator
MPTTNEMLAEVPLFALLDEQERTLVAERMDVCHFPKGEILFTRGEPGGSLWVVRTGQVELFFKNDTGNRILLEVANAGDFFGEVSFLDGGSRATTSRSFSGADPRPPWTCSRRPAGACARQSAR